jgi:hypothetical protein
MSAFKPVLRTSAASSAAIEYGAPIIQDPSYCGAYILDIESILQSEGGATYGVTPLKPEMFSDDLFQKIERVRQTRTGQPSVDHNQRVFNRLIFDLVQEQVGDEYRKYCSPSAKMPLLFSHHIRSLSHRIFPKPPLTGGNFHERIVPKVIELVAKWNKPMSDEARLDAMLKEELKEQEVRDADDLEQAGWETVITVADGILDKLVGELAVELQKMDQSRIASTAASAPVAEHNRAHDAL